MRKFIKIINDNTIIERIIELRKRFAGNRGKSKFARAIGISPSTYSYYEENRVPPIETLLAISRLTGSDLHWILTGKSLDSVQFRGVLAQNRAIFDKISALLNEHPDMSEPISAFIDLLAEKKGFEETTQPTLISKSNRKPGWIPVLGRTAAGMVHCWSETTIPDSANAVTKLDDLVKKHTGREIMQTSELPVCVDIEASQLTETFSKASVNLVRVRSATTDEPVEFIECEEISGALPDSFALHVDGDSMSPRINDGDIVILSPSVPASNGQLAIAHIADQIGVTCKLLRLSPKGVHLVPINERYETKVIPQKDLVWALAVLCHVNL